MSAFDVTVIVDWSARSKPSPRKPTKDSIFFGVVKGDQVDVIYHRTRSAAIQALEVIFDDALAAGQSVLAGFDFPFGYPMGFAEAVTGKADVFALWEWLVRRIEDADDNGNNRFDVAEELNTLFPGIGPFWGCPVNRATDVLPMKGRLRHRHGLAERRAVEDLLPSAQPCWKLFTTGSVGSQVLLGIPRLQALRARYGNQLSVRPFETHDTPIVLAEIYPSLLNAEVRRQQRDGEILDAAQVRVLAQAFARVEGLDALLREGDPEEGWIVGLGHEAALSAAARW